MTTQADLQNAVDQAAPGSTVRFPEGTHELDATDGGIKMKSGIKLDLTGVTLQARSTSGGSYRIIEVFNCEDVEITDGQLLGERATNPNNGDWRRGDLMGVGIEIRGSRNVTVRRTQIKDCMGDGILVWHARGPLEIDHVVADHNRRQGMSIVDGSSVHVHDSQFSRSGGTPPGCGIDIENDSDNETCADILIERNVFYGNEGSCVAAGSPGQYHNIRVTPDNSFDMKSQPIWAGGNARPLGTPWWALLLNRTLGSLPGYRWWGYPIQYYHA